MNTTSWPKRSWRRWLRRRRPHPPPLARWKPAIGDAPAARRRDGIADPPPNGDSVVHAIPSARAVAKRLAALLAEDIRRQHTDLATACGDQTVEQLLRLHDAFEAQAQTLLHQCAQANESLVSRLGTAVLDPLADHLLASLTKRCETILAATTDELREAASTAFRDAALLPVIERLIALADRLHRERHELAEQVTVNATRFFDVERRKLVDAHDRALEAAHAEVHLILAAMDVHPLIVPLGPFNPQVQQVVGTEPTTDPHRDRHVARVVRPGYTRGGQPLRPEQVMVYKHKEQN